jgi:hypothetical protein
MLCEFLAYGNQKIQTSHILDKIISLVFVCSLPFIQLCYARRLWIMRLQGNWLAVLHLSFALLVLSMASMAILQNHQLMSRFLWLGFFYFFFKELCVFIFCMAI